MLLFKKAIIALVLAIIASGCGSANPNPAAGAAPSSCQGIAIVGVWEILPGPTDILTLNSDCTGTQTRCGATFTYSVPSGNPGTGTVTVQTTNGNPGCLSVGAHTCSYNYDATNMALNCGTIVNYTRQP